MASLEEQLDIIEAQFELDADKLQAILSRFRNRMEYGLEREGANMAMIPSFVTGVPDGSEKGTYLALDLGGTNLRVCEVNLDGKGSFEMKQEKYKVSDELKTGKAKELFGFIAKSVQTFLLSGSSSHGAADEELLLGFTFSFPVEQTAIDRGCLIKWTKGFDVPDAIGQDVVTLLQSCLDDLKVKVRVNALVNDTVGALLAHGYQSRGPALLGAIFGTGTNGAYIEDRNKVVKLEVEDPIRPVPTSMIVNTEWGGFDDERNVLPITMFDNFVDRTAIRPRHHALEKMISGMYLGEVTRTIMIHLIDSLVLFQGFSSTKLNEMYAFDTAYMSAIMADNDQGPASATHKVLVETMGLDAAHVGAEDIAAVKRICRFVGRRAARLSAVAVAAVLQHTNKTQSNGSGAADDVVEVGVDGSVVEFLPQFTKNVKEALRIMVGEEAEKRTRFGLAKNGSGVGAALCALQAKKQSQGTHHPHAKPHEK